MLSKRVIEGKLKESRHLYVNKMEKICSERGVVESKYWVSSGEGKNREKRKIWRGGK
jgi:hypothetical protein